jgi:hypothetical protein
MMNAIPHITAAIKFPTHIPDLSKQGRTVIAAMTSNPHFPSPNPTLAAITTAFDELDTAETVAKTRAKGTAQARNLKLKQAKNLMLQAKGYVQQVADANPDQAEAIIESAGMSVRKKVPRQKQGNEVRQGVSGAVELYAVVASLAAAYEWQMSGDGKSWTNLTTTSRSRTSVTGLTPGQVTFFRNRPVLRKGSADWSQPISLLIK